MTSIQKEELIKLRNEGFGYKRISKTLDISENTVKSFCRRNGLGGVSNIESQHINTIKKEIHKNVNNLCANCGKVVNQTEGYKTKKFCTDECRKQFWAKNRNKINRKTAKEFKCSVCGEIYFDYEKSNRKYCSRECYIKGRYGR